MLYAKMTQTFSVVIKRRIGEDWGGCDSPVESKVQGANSHHHTCDLHISKNYLSVHILDLEFHSNLSVVCRLAGLYFFFLCSCSNMVHAFILLPGT